MDAGNSQQPQNDKDLMEIRTRMFINEIMNMETNDLIKNYSF